MKKIAVKEFGIYPGDDKENTLRLRTLLNECRSEDGIQILFDEGEYHFHPDYAVEKLLYISNHDEDTIKRIIFDLKGYQNISIYGNNTIFIFHSECIPFYLHESTNVTVEGITIDYARTVYSEGVIREVEERRMVMEIDEEEYPFEVVHNRLYFKGDGYCNEMTHGCLEMDYERLGPVYGGRDTSFASYYSSSFSTLFRKLAPNLVEAMLTDEEQRFLASSKVGNRLILRHHARTHPAFYITNSKEVILRNITLYHCSGMVVISQFSENVEIDHFDVRIHPEKKRIFTATADGFHFVYSKGKIHIHDCLLENQLDDPVNIHGIYGRIHKVISETEVLVELVEGMQKGVRLGNVGDCFGILNNNTLLQEGCEHIAKIEMLNKDYMYMCFEKPVKSLKVGYVVENKEFAPEILVENCTFRNNRARGLLLTSAGKTVIRNNCFQSAGAAILIEGDCNYWFESGAITDILIEGNLFEDCAYIPQWGNAPIQVSPGVLEFVQGQYYHKSIKIINNTFKCFDKRVLEATGVERIEFVGNSIQSTTTFPAIEGEKFVLYKVGDFVEA